MERQKLIDMMVSAAEKMSAQRMAPKKLFIPWCHYEEWRESKMAWIFGVAPENLMIQRSGVLLTAVEYDKKFPIV